MCLFPAENLRYALVYTCHTQGVFKPRGAPPWGRSGEQPQFFYYFFASFAMALTLSFRIISMYWESAYYAEALSKVYTRVPSSLVIRYICRVVQASSYVSSLDGEKKRTGATMLIRLELSRDPTSRSREHNFLTLFISLGHAMFLGCWIYVLLWPTYA